MHYAWVRHSHKVGLRQDTTNAHMLRLNTDLSCAVQDMETFLDTMSAGGSQAATSEVPFLGAVLHVQRKEFTAAQGTLLGAGVAEAILCAGEVTRALVGGSAACAAQRVHCRPRCAACP